LTVVIGLAFIIERMVTLNLAKGNTKKFIAKINKVLAEEGPEKAMEVCSNTRGPVASIFNAGLMKMNKGIDQVEKSVMNAGQVELAFLEKNLIWLASVIAIAPMLGFLGTVSGMINAFDAIAAANDISPAIVASGIAEALITTMFGLTVAIPVQLAHNWFVSIIDGIVMDMQESSTEFVDQLSVYLDKHPQA
jgi:biopolymer transport protein ExbB